MPTGTNLCSLVIAAGKNPAAVVDIWMALSRP